MREGFNNQVTGGTSDDNVRRSGTNLGARASCPQVLTCARPAGETPALPGLHLTKIKFHVEGHPEGDRRAVFHCGPKAHLHGRADGFFVQTIRQASEDAHLFH